MTSPTDTLVERVAAAIRAGVQLDYAGRMTGCNDAARAAIRVVVEACAELCTLPAFGVDATAFGDPVKWSRPPKASEIAARIRRLAPEQSP